jgi:hypothetical protein
MNNERVEEFWNIAAPHLAAGTCDEGTMMGNACLRVKGEFVAMHWAKGGGMIVKLDKESVQRHIEAGTGNAFAPNGRVFKEWISIADANHESWPAILEEGIGFASKRK